MTHQRIKQYAWKWWRGSIVCAAAPCRSGLTHTRRSNGLFEAFIGYVIRPRRLSVWCKWLASASDHTHPTHALLCRITSTATGNGGQLGGLPRPGPDFAAGGVRGRRFPTPPGLPEVQARRGAGSAAAEAAARAARVRGLLPRPAGSEWHVRMQPGAAPRLNRCGWVGIDWDRFNVAAATYSLALVLG